MKLNTKVRYGLRTIIELAINHDKESGVFQKDIAEKQNISNKYLDQIIASLKANGLIANVQGKKSGYRLLKKPSEITVYDVYKTFESDLQVVDCIAEQQNCKKTACCASRDFWADFNDQLIAFLKSQSIQDIAEKQKKYSQSEENIYFI